LAKTHREASASAPAIVTIVLAEEQFEKEKNDDGIKKKKRIDRNTQKLVKLQH
jgi:hypothetical protein